MPVRVVEGDLLEQPVEAVVNAWNRNVLPWWLLVPQGVSGAIKKRAGLEPFRELAKLGPIPLGQAVATGPGRLPHKAMLHVAGINLLWRSSEASIRGSVGSAVALAQQLGLRSIAMPLIGSGSGGCSEAEAERLILDELEGCAGALEVLVVRYRRGARGS